MKNRIGVVLLVLLALGLGVALISIKHEANRTKAADTETILSLSNTVVDVNSKLKNNRMSRLHLKRIWTRKSNRLRRWLWR